MDVLGPAYWGNPRRKLTKCLYFLSLTEPLHSLCYYSSLVFALLWSCLLRITDNLLIFIFVVVASNVKLQQAIPFWCMWQKKTLDFWQVPYIYEFLDLHQVLSKAEIRHLSQTSPSVEGSISEYRESQMMSSTFFNDPVETPGKDDSQS